jgi:dTDP-4-amino-4,6-dideoxygalactose transaminase
VRYGFYRLERDLNVAFPAFLRQIERLRPRVVVLIHYFGWPDRHYAEMVQSAQASGALVLEDSAHALLTDVIGGAVGRLGDASIWSLHKLLPVPSGGALVVPERELDADASDGASGGLAEPLAFDLAGMSAHRREMCVWLQQAVSAYGELLDPLRPELPAGVVPQTFPVMIRGATRDVLYESLNAAGFGAVSLYHTLIPEISPETFPESHRVSRAILNLPVHEGATPEGLRLLLRTLAEHTATQLSRPR